MATIDKLDMSVYNLYAIRTKMIEQIQQQMPLDKAQSIPAHTAIFDTYPKLTEIDILLGIVPMFTPWAYFYPPKNFRFQRRASFSFSKVASSLGDQEKLESLLASIECNTPEEEEEKAKLISCKKNIDKLNGWLGFIIGRVGQFLQG